MIAYIKGNLVHRTPAEAIVETAGGVAYQMAISLYTFGKLPESGEVRLLTHLVVKEDGHSLYGFADEGERHLFVLLIGVSGIGPGTARLLLSSLPAAELRAAIASENETVLHSVKGIGPKSAKRLILELKDKVQKDGFFEETAQNLPMGTGNKAREEALSALLALGFQKIAAQRVLNALLKEQPGISDPGTLVKLALKSLS
jgi:Holliday junction DNA helicase RuvA